jgi:hypothetical protein
MGLFNAVLFLSPLSHSVGEGLGEGAIHVGDGAKFKMPCRYHYKE